MSTYNGEQFLAEQIKSNSKQIVQKTGHYISETTALATAHQKLFSNMLKKDSRIVFINADNRENFGVIKNFYTLLKT